MLLAAGRGGFPFRCIYRELPIWADVFDGVTRSRWSPILSPGASRDRPFRILID